eukprot:6497661-Pyramimonas_sp.AAC.1
MEKQRKHAQRDNRARAVEPPIGSGGKHLWTEEGQEVAKNPPWASEGRATRTGASGSAAPW